MSDPLAQRHSAHRVREYAMLNAAPPPLARLHLFDRTGVEVRGRLVGAGVAIRLFGGLPEIDR